MCCGLPSCRLHCLTSTASCVSLIACCASGNRIGLDPEGRPCSSGLAAFSTWFRQKCRLTSLNLSSNHLGNEEALGFGQDLAFLNTLQTLDLHDNNVKVGDEQAADVVSRGP